MTGSQHDIPARWRRPCGKAGGPWSSGAGVSAESGIATFRDALTGLWSRFDAQALATPRPSAPIPTWSGAGMNGDASRPCAPGRTPRTWPSPDWPRMRRRHRDHAERGRSARARGQSESTASGSLHAPRCADCRAPWSRAEPASADAAAAGTTAADIRTADAATASAAASGAPNGEQDEGRRIEPPRCAACGGPVRPGVVWFGESLPADAWRAAQLAAEQCDLLLSIGTSALVYPAAELPQRALAAAPSSRRSIRPPRQWMRA